MLASVSRRPQAVVLAFLLPRAAQTRYYTQQKPARTPRSTSQQSTTNPSASPTSQPKNRSSSPSFLPSTSSTSVKAGAAAAKANGKEFAKLRMGERMRELEESGEQLEMLRMSYAAGMDPASEKATLMDLRIPRKIDSFATLKDNLNNDIQNMLSMFRLATDIAFPGIITKWKYNPQVFLAKSTSEKAWVAPFRHDLLDVYKRINQAIASGDKKTLKELTAYEYQHHAYQLLQRNLTRSKQTGLTYHWALHSLLSPVKIVSLRAYPLYSAPEEPRYGNRNVAQAIVKFESLQTLVARDSKGRIVKRDGKVIEKEKEGEEYKPDPRRVLEYLLCENKMFYPDGWYVRDQVFEGVKPKFSSNF